LTRVASPTSINLSSGTSSGATITID
jgi:hypothetical protein